MEHLFAKPGAILINSKERLQYVCIHYQGKRRREEFAKVYEELDEWYEDEMREKRDWMHSAMESTDRLNAERRRNAELQARILELENQLADIAEHLDQEHGICLPK